MEIKSMIAEEPHPEEEMEDAGKDAEMDNFPNSGPKPLDPKKLVADILKRHGL